MGNNYIDNTVIRLQRQYSKDELVAHMIKNQKKLEFELGGLKSENDALESVIINLSKMDSKKLQHYQMDE